MINGEKKGGKPHPGAPEPVRITQFIEAQSPEKLV